MEAAGGSKEMSAYYCSDARHKQEVQFTQF